MATAEITVNTHGAVSAAPQVGQVNTPNIGSLGGGKWQLTLYYNAHINIHTYS